MICQKGEERKEKKDAKCTTMHRFVNIASESTLQRKNRNVGNSKQMQHPVHRTGNHPSAPEGARAQEETETWQPGKVLLNKISTNNTYLATTNFWAPLEMEEEDNK